MEGFVEDTVGGNGKNNEELVRFEPSVASVLTTISSFDKISTICDFVMDLLPKSIVIDKMDIALYSQQLKVVCCCNDFAEVLFDYTDYNNNNNNNNHNDQDIVLNFMYWL